MPFARLALTLTFVLAAAPVASAGRAKTAKPHAARKADTHKQRSTRVAPATPARDGKCTRVLLADLPFRELRLVGIVSQGRTEKALLMDASDVATTITRGECIGIERVPYDDVVRPLREELASR